MVVRYFCMSAFVFPSLSSSYSSLFRAIARFPDLLKTGLGKMSNLHVVTNLILQLCIKSQ